ncbi:uncharacterized protein LOC143547727 [Bidens hawaiensis]|uniref:uncharacterized protein LOC143547727 n=1 Tax=Bidens hawaiensis TaxID=980011 RepID=UPI00404B8996
MAYRVNLKTKMLHVFQFIDMLNPGRPTEDMKIRLMEEIAQEHGVEWDPESLDTRLYKPFSSHRDWSIRAGDDQDKDSRGPEHENEWMINIQETINDDNNARKKDELDADLQKQAESMRHRLWNYLSRTTSLHSTSSRETSTSSDGSSTSLDDSTKSRSFFNFWPPYVRNDPNKKETNSNVVYDSPTNNKQKHDGNKENKDVLVHPNVEKRDDEKVVVAERVKNIRRRKNGALPRVSSVAVEEPSNLTVKPRMRHVHPKLPDYDEIKAWFMAFRTKS